MIQQGVDEGAIRVAGARVDDDAGRFVDDKNGLILVDDIDRDFLFNPFFILIVKLCPDLDRLTTLDGIFLLQRSAVYGDKTISYPCLQAGAGMLRA